MEYNMKEMVARIHGLANAHGMSNRELALKLDMSCSIVSHWDRGTEPKIEALAKICKLFHTSADFLMFGTSPQKEVITMETSMAGNFREYDMLEDFRSLSAEEQLMAYGYIHGMVVGNRQKASKKDL